MFDTTSFSDDTDIPDGSAEVLPAMTCMAIDSTCATVDPAIGFPGATLRAERPPVMTPAFEKSTARRNDKTWPANTLAVEFVGLVALAVSTPGFPPAGRNAS